MGALVTAVTALALVAGVVTTLTTRALRSGVRILLDVLTAAGVLRLAGEPGWSGLAGAAAIIVLRQVLGMALSRPPPWSGRQSPAPCADDDHHLPLASTGEAGKAGG
ncbi:hypothetical protein EV382_1702 [Micromonospora violae]|uniref:DUF1622 domain-containing protein n=1 Tax=Micromonospora violae TaxID=1278207 RepID=A0A4Q7UBV4_9ACTN|nr:hypothetical protein [Micromonospora violae]RZT78516.1 hypothetical protein EV382_1702 [Micromonospora violae]